MSFVSDNKAPGSEVVLGGANVSLGVSCNILMPRGLTPEKSRQVAAYLTRVETYYAGQVAA